MTSFIYKPSTWKGPVFLAPSTGPRESPIFTTSSGQKYTGQYFNTNEGRHQWVLPREILGQNDISVSYGGQTGKISSGGQSFEGDSLGDWLARDKGSVGAGGSYPGGFAPGMAGQYGVYPAYLGNMFPSPTLINYAPIKGANYKYIDPLEYAKAHSAEITDLYKQNASTAREIALGDLDTELRGLESFAPAATALKQSLTSADNQFNQAMRTAQLQNTLPGVLGNLSTQTKDAATYASGRVPDSINDRALELGIRSRAADNTSAGGFGGPAARKINDLMSAEERLKIAQYGNQLVGQNAQSRAALELAPTEYSNAGEQIRVTPSVSASQLAAQSRGELNNLNNLPIGAALSSTVQQKQFKAGLTQQTQQFNASNTLAKDEFNATNQNQFALDKFGYQVGFAGAVAGATQTDVNTNAAIAQQNANRDIFNDFMHQAQEAGTANSIASGIASLLGGGGQAIGSIIGSLYKGVFGDGTDTGSGTGDSGGGSVSGDAGGSSSGITSGGGSGPISVPDFSADSGGGEVSTPSTGVSPDFNIPSQDSSVPDFSYDPGPSLSDSFTADTGINLESLSPRTLQARSAGVMSAAGIHTEPLPNTSFVGYSPQARPVFSNVGLASSNNPQMGAQYVDTFKGIVGPLNALSTEDVTNLNNIATRVSDPSTINSLNELQSSGDAKGFVQNVKNTTGTSSAKDAYAAYNLMQNWGKMSTAQKAIGLSALAIHGAKYGGHNLGAVPLVKGANGQTELSLGQGLALFSAGYNTYSLVKNWNQLNPIQKIAVGTQDAFKLAALSKQFGLLGSGTSGAATPITAQALSAAGWKSAPQFGIGAVTGNSASQIPNGYSVVSRTPNGVIATPTSTMASFAGAASFTAGALTVYSNWGKGGVKGAVNGAIGGSAMAAGLMQLGYTNPYLAAGIIGFSILSDTIGKDTFSSGKSGAQKGRDDIRANIQRAGVSDDAHGIVLPDGTTANIGVDGHGGTHEFRNSSLIQGKNQKLSAFDVDYTNDMDFTSNLAGNALSRLINGGKQTASEQLGGQLGNAFLGKVGFGKDMTASNFANVMANARAVYAKAGINNKSDMYQLINQGFAEGRWNESDVTAMQQAGNLMYDKNGFDTAQKLMAGRFRGIEVAKDHVPSKTSIPENSAAKVIPLRPGTAASWSDLMKLKRPIQDIDPGFSANINSYGDSGINASVNPFQNGTKLTKEELLARNKLKFNVAPYQTQAA